MNKMAKLLAISAKWGSANYPRWANFMIFKQFFYTKSKLRGDLFYTKKCHHKNFGPRIAGCFD